MTIPATFIGRADELSRLAGALADETRMVLVVGDAGVGKTRLAQEVMTRAAAGGMVAVPGECLPLGETLPLLPVASALDVLARLDGGEPLDAALAVAPGYVRGEVGRLLPGLGSAPGTGQWGWDREWQRGRLFLAVTELLDAVARVAEFGLVLVIEDVHWADSQTLDFLTFLTRAGYRDAVTVVATCRGDEALPAHVADWLAQVRSVAGVAEMRLGPLSRAEVAGQAAALADGPVPPWVVDELYARAEGNPFFTEQLVAAALAGRRDGRLSFPAGLPRRLAELLQARADRCAGDARAVLAGLAVAGRPLAEDMLAAVTGLDAEAVRGGLRELAAARLLAEDGAGSGCRPRHALLAEAVAGMLLPGERVALHENLARELAAAGDQALAAEVAGHWQAAGDHREELPARVAAARAAETVFGYSEAAAHWQRAIDIVQAEPGAVGVPGFELPVLYLRALNALEWSGASVRAETVAEEGYRRFADHPDPATAAALRHRAAYYRSIEAPGTGLLLIEEALRLFEQVPAPSAEHAGAWLDYAYIFLRSAQERQDDIVPALNRALAMAENASATALIPRIMASLSTEAFRRGQVEEGFAFLARGLALARAEDDGMSLAILAANESDALLKLARFDRAADVARCGLGRARQVGLQASWVFNVVTANACEALLAGGHTTEAAALVDPLTTGSPDRDNWLEHEARADVDLLRGDIDAAVSRRLLIDAIPANRGNPDFARESAQRAADLALWAGHPGDALNRVQQVLPLYETRGLAVRCGWLLAAGMRACADLAEQARAQADEPAAQAAEAAADGLSSWVDQMAAAPLTEHPFMATIPAERASWEAERTRLAGASDPEGWSRAAKTWEELGCPHRAAYGWWRQAQAQLDAGQPAAEAATALRAAAAAADGHAPLLAQVRLLAERARITLDPEPAAAGETPPAKRVPGRYGLTDRELAVLRLLAAGRSNAQIGAELYISPSTASVHVTSILRKLRVSNRVQAAALAERAGLLPPGPA
jgi:DNA-binding CsgD family transcriptional regulator